MKKLTFAISFMLLTFSLHAQTTQTLEVQVNQESDDAEESEDGNETYITSSDLELVFDDYSNQNNQTVGIRFQSVEIPSDADIIDAYIQFHVDETDAGETNLLIKGELSDNSLTFNESANNISNRQLTTALANWDNIPAWTETHIAGEDQRTPDLSNIVSEIINLDNWTYGNPITFIITGSGTRTAESYDGTSDEAPILHLEYTLPATPIDLALQNIDGIDDYMYADDQVSLDALIENTGTEPVDTFVLSYALDSQTPVTDTVTSIINPGNSYNHTFAQTLNLSEIGTHTLLVEVMTVGDSLSFNNTIERTFEVVAEYSDLYFDENSIWIYNDSGSDLGTDWTGATYDDSDWKLGSGHFGFGDNDENVLLEDGHITYYFRKTINIDNIDNINTIVMDIVADDAAVVYINGQEVIRSLNLPDGIIAYNTTASRISTADFENEPLRYNINKSFFSNGLNTIAIEIHNASASNVDVSFSCRITDQPIEYNLDGPYVFHRDNNIIIKSITTQGPVVDTFPEGDNPVLTCNLPNGDSFSFNLMSEMSIPEPTYEMPEKFFVTSDIEGQIEAFTFLLQNAGIIDSDYNWIYGNGHLYFVGDMFDRGYQVTESIWLLYKLEQEAKLAGGDVHFIIGNHEIMNFIQDFRYVQEKYYHNAHYLGEMLDDMYNTETELGQWFRTKNIIEKAGDSAIFVHAGISKQVENLNLSFEQMNDYGRTGMDDPYCDNGNNACQIINGGSDMGIYWYRGMAYQDLSQQEVDDILNTFNAEKVIFGHSVFPQITTLYNQKVIAVDVDHSDNYNNNGYMEALNYQNGCYFRFVTNGTTNTYEPLNPNCDTSTNVIDRHLNEGELNIVPNPFNHQLTIEHRISFEKTNVTVYNAVGKVIEEITPIAGTNQITLETDKWNDGFYLLKIQLDDQIITKKVIKR